VRSSHKDLRVVKNVASIFYGLISLMAYVLFGTHSRSICNRAFALILCCQNEGDMVVRTLWICDAGNNNGIPDGGETFGPHICMFQLGAECRAEHQQDASDRRRERPNNAAMWCKFVIDSNQNACVSYVCVAIISARAKANPFNWTQAINGYRYLSCCFESHLYLEAGAFY
jgi:hypothetical protein